ncbi:MAG: GNAT family N-acetyltransferase [Lachnospiraceae bacterium]|nr:GNAT family N-acetyltransferase [Lachnospiraceae bacterium]
MIRKAIYQDIAEVERIYDELHQAEEEKRITTGWKRNIYPTGATALEALKRDDLFVLENEGIILGAGIINRAQVDVYSGAPWKHDAEDDRVCVLHTLVISPSAGRKGYGKEFVRFYEEYAKEQGCFELRIDTNERNTVARAMYKRLGYEEIAIVPTTFNGISGVNLVLLEKWLGLKQEGKR